MPERGRVVELKNSSALVEMDYYSEACANCGVCTFVKDSGKMVMEVSNSLGAKIGDIVTIELEAKNLILAAFIVYILPLIFFFVGYGIFSLFLKKPFSPEGAGIIGGIVFTIFAYFLIRKIDRSAKISRRFEPRIYAIIQKN